MYSIPQAPVLVAIAGCFIAFTCGSAFWNMMEQKLRESYQEPEQDTSFQINRFSDFFLTISYFGVCLGMWIFLGGGLHTFGFGVIPAYGAALLIAVFTAGLVWDQINKVLIQLKEGGSEALSLDDIT